MTEKDKLPGKIEIKIGAMSFSAEGDQDWLSEQLTKVIEAAAARCQDSVETPKSDASPFVDSQSFKLSLASYIKSKEAETNQVMRFLATAGWLRNRGTKDLTTSGVAKALSENHQKRLANPSDCLNKNTAKGYCEKSKHGFFITPEGLKVLGESNDSV
ncbi:hypothetical protein CU048_01660 [Beijerinckiaceae bacterium]|nr:hypothetical protein CU048_01660 [Beijerinckiaceae bacterium]